MNAVISGASIAGAIVNGAAGIAKKAIASVTNAVLGKDADNKVADSEAEAGKGENDPKGALSKASETESKKKADLIAALRDSIPGGREIPKGKDLVDIMKQDPEQFPGIKKPGSSAGGSSSSPDPAAQANAAGSAGAGGSGGGSGGGGLGGGWPGAGARPGGGFGGGGGVSPGGGIGGGGHHHAAPEVFTDIAKYQQHFKEEGGTVKFNDQKVKIGDQEFYTGIHTTGNNQEHPILASVKVVEQSRLAIDSMNSHSTGQADQLTASSDANQITNEAAQAAPPPAPPPLMPEPKEEAA